MGIGSVIIRKLVRDPKVIRIKQHYDRFGELFDGLLFITSVTKFHCLIPYIQKLLFTIMLVFVKDCTVQIPLLIIVKLGFYALSANIIPVYYIELFIRVPLGVNRIGRSLRLEPDDSNGHVVCLLGPGNSQIRQDERRVGSVEHSASDHGYSDTLGALRLHHYRSNAAP